MLRRLLAYCLMVGLVGVSGCKGDDAASSEAATKAVAEAGNIASEADDLIGRRDLLLSDRRKLKDKRAELDEKHRAAVASGADTAEIEAAKQKLADEERGLDEREGKINSTLEELLSQRRAIQQALAASGSDKGTKVAAREAGVAAREKGFARRESAIASREAEMAKRERDLAKFRLEKCGAVASAPTTIIRTVDVKGSKYTKRDVEPLLKKARRAMSKKGILRSDLPAQAQGLEKEATRSMGKGDYGRARFAASQLYATIKATRINKAFVSAKIGRLSSRMRGKTLSSRAQKEVDKLFREATANYGDGKFSSANRRLNKIYSRIR